MTFRKSPMGPLDYHRRPLPLLVFISTLIFIYLPVITLIAFSFNDSRRNIIWHGFTLKYYEKAFANAELMLAFGNSLSIALVSTLFSGLLGAMAAYLLWRFRFRGRAIFEGAMAMPIVIPEICMGVAMMAFIARAGWPQDLPWPLNLGAITAAHIAFCFPFTAIVIRARLESFNRQLADAARDLGAAEFQIFRDIVLPHMKPGIIAGGLLAFTLSLDDFVITFFTSGPDSITFPVKIYSMVRFSVTPEVNAASAMLITLTVLVTAIALRIQNRHRMRGG
ncbi:MAG: ABC transporter permease [Alphaproteobacteria bacterium]